MTPRERWQRCVHFQPVDYIPDEEFGYWDETLKEWHKQGLPEEIDTNEKADEYFGFSQRSFIWPELWLIPPFETKVVEETEKYKIIIAPDGSTQQIFKNGKSTIPHFIDFALKGRKEWEELFKPRLNISTKERYPENRKDWEEIKKKYNDPLYDKPVGIWFGSLFGWLRDWAGFEGISLLCYDDPELVMEMVSHLADLIVTVIKKSVEEIKLDFAAGWEDMCFNKGPIISPAMVKKFLVPNYKKITELLKNNGCDIIYTDCDGNINQLIDLWLEAGLTAIFPVEVAAGSDPVEIRKKYKDKIVIIGGVNKKALIAGKDAIKNEIKRIKPFVKEGGWIPHVDHRCPPDVTFENYIYYLYLKRETFKIPHPEELDKRDEIKKIKSKWKREDFLL